MDIATWDRVMAVNLRGPFLMAKHVAPHMVKRKIRQDHQYRLGHRRTSGMPWMIALRHPKGGIATLTRAMSRELGDDGISVNTLMPGFALSDSIVESGSHSEARAERVDQQSARSSATRTRRTCSARWCSSPRPTAISSPGRPSRSMAAR